MRKLPGFAASRGMNGLRQLAKVAITPQMRFASRALLTAGEIGRHQNVGRWIVLPVGEEFIGIP